MLLWRKKNICSLVEKPYLELYFLIFHSNYPKGYFTAMPPSVTENHIIEIILMNDMEIKKVICIFPRMQDTSKRDRGDNNFVQKE